MSSNDIALDRVRGLLKSLSDTLFTTEPPLSRSMFHAALRTLCAILDNNDLDESAWYIGEDNGCCVCELIVGAYWFFGDYHGGQWSDESLTRCALGKVFNPGSTSGVADGSPDQDVYDALCGFFGYEVAS